MAELNLAAGKRARRRPPTRRRCSYFNAGAALLAAATRWEGGEGWTQRYDCLRARAPPGRVRVPDRRARGGGGAARRADAPRARASSTPPRSPSCRWISTRPPATAATRRRGLPRVPAAGRHQWSPHPTDEEVQAGVRADVAAARQPSDRGAASTLPAMTEPVWRATVDVLTIAMAPALVHRRESAAASSSARVANLSLEHGNSEGSCTPTSCSAMILGPHFGDYDGRVPLRQARPGPDGQRGPLRLKARVYFGFAQMVSPWRRHIRERPRAAAARLRGGAAEPAICRPRRTSQSSHDHAPPRGGRAARARSQRARQEGARLRAEGRGTAWSARS